MIMPAYLCPKGHDSVDPDFCSVCGVKVQPAMSQAFVCPDCGAKREPAGGTFCEICGFNFSTGSHGELKPSPPSPVVEAPPPAPPETSTWELLVSVDPALREPDSPEPPTAFEPLTIRIEQESNLIGRRSERRAIDPQVALDHDDAVSHRHALLTRSTTSGLSLRDIGSSNGTRLNGTAVTALADTPLKDGDVITLGHWTRIAIKAVQ